MSACAGQIDAIRTQMITKPVTGPSNFSPRLPRDDGLDSRRLPIRDLVFRFCRLGQTDGRTDELKLHRVNGLWAMSSVRLPFPSRRRPSNLLSINRKGRVGRAAMRKNVAALPSRQLDTAGLFLKF